MGVSLHTQPKHLVQLPLNIDMTHAQGVHLHTHFLSFEEIKDVNHPLIGFQNNLHTQIWIASTTPDDLLQKL